MHAIAGHDPGSFGGAHCENVPQQVTETYTTCVTRKVPYQATRQVSVCVPVTETVMCCRMVPRCVEKEVPAVSVGCESAYCGSAHAGHQRKHKGHHHNACCGATACCQ